MNGWAHDYWQTIGWVEFWASWTEAIGAGQPAPQADPVAKLEGDLASLIAR